MRTINAEAPRVPVFVLVGFLLCGYYVFGKYEVISKRVPAKIDVSFLGTLFWTGDSFLCETVNGH